MCYYYKKEPAKYNNEITKLINYRIVIILTFLSASCNPGAKVIQAAIVLSNSMIAYMILVDVELRHDGQAEQHNEHAALPQQHAN